MAELSEITSGIISNNLDNFFDSIDIFVSKPKFGNDLGDIFAEGLKVYLKLGITKSVSIHLLDESDFTFQHRLTLPNSFSNRSIECFENFVEKGFIGKTLSEGSAYYFSQEDNPFRSPFVLIPMIASWGIMGMILVELEDNSEDFDSYFIKLFQIHTNILSSAIERVQLFDKMTTQNSSLEQKVAIRTHKLNQSQNEIRAIFNAVQTGIFVCDDKNTIVNHNQEAYELLEADKTSLVGLCIDDVLGKINQDNESKLKTLKNREIDVLVNQNDTQITDQLFKVYSILDISSRKVAQNALLELNKDLESIVNQRTQDLENSVKQLEKEIEERRKAETEIKKMLEQEKELNTLKSKFIKTVSHEFRTPLTVIRSAAQLLDVYGDQLPSEDKKKYVSRVINTVDFLTELIENVLHVGKQDGFDENENKIDVGSYLKELVEFKFSEFKDKIIFDLQDDSTIYGNRKSLDVIFVNLINNAEKYSKKDSKIEISTRIVGSRVLINILNHGIGIPEKDKKRIFDLFYRGENVGNITGIGLGLAVVKQCVNLLDGTIYFDSEENGKTIFTVEFKSADA